MSTPIASYSFLPWLRQGIANNITQADLDPSVKLRAKIPIRVTVSGTKPDGTALTDQNIDKEIEMYGPGDIVGIDPRAIIKTEPRNFITNFEPNYVPYIDFYEEDFPWRYSPAAPAADRLRPWLTLVVLKEDEFEDGVDMKDTPLPYFKLKGETKAANIFPKPSELWAWAHVHVNVDLSNGAAPNTANANEVTREILNLLKNNPDMAYSRIISPRKLEANIGYHAFLISSFESGRLAGLARSFPADPATKVVTLPATESAWDTENKIEFPYYHRWYFRTGSVGDFEYLVNLLQPKPADKSVGVRDLDVLHPGANLPPIDNPELDGILKLGGALRVPFDSMKQPDQEEVRRFDEWDQSPYPHPFNRAMAQRINLAEDYTDKAKSITEINENVGITLDDTGKGDPDPVVTSPLYGRWQALQQRLLSDDKANDLPYNQNWIHELNLDPRFRVAAGLGTGVVQKNQEQYMQAAWEQVGKIVEANNYLRLSQMSKEISSRLYELHLLQLLNNKAFLFTSPVHKRVVFQNLTVQTHLQESLIPPAVTSGTFRRVIRPRGRTIKMLLPDRDTSPTQVIEEINAGRVIVAPPKGDPEGAIGLAQIPKYVLPGNTVQFLKKLFRALLGSKYYLFAILLIILVIILLFFLNPAGLILLGMTVLGLMVTYVRLRRGVSQDSQTPEEVEKYPKRPDFVITRPGSKIAPSSGSSDSDEAFRFKAGLRDAFTLVSTKFPEPQRKPLDLHAVAKQVVESLNPAVTIPKRTFAHINLPPRIRDNMVETFAPVMVHPEMDVPMYQPLAKISSELFLPNLNKIGYNSITLLENNQKFIEAYMVGINHEMSRELLWREYPTDQRGTYFRQFWDTSSFLSKTDSSVDELKARYKRILDKRRVSNLYYYYLLLESSTGTIDSELLNEAEAVITREELKDIVPINYWSKTNTSKVDDSDPDSQKINELGTHNQRAELSGKTQLVLVIRGELLKKYPTAVIYAQRADWGTRGSGGQKDVQEERVLVELTAAESQNPPSTKLKTPLFEAKIDPDVYFLGFDLDDEEARGTLNPTSITDNPGWFFVLRERPGEPRFGLDIEKAKTEDGQERIINWNNLSWKDLETPEGHCIELNKTITFNSYNSTTDQENKPNADDDQAKWSPLTNSAELAYILYQVPVMVAVHASRMLPSAKE